MIQHDVFLHVDPVGIVELLVDGVGVDVAVERPCAVSADRVVHVAGGNHRVRAVEDEGLVSAIFV